jgi:MFS family permease
MSALQTLTANFSVLRNRSFRIYLSGQTVSLLGTWLQQTALGWVVWSLTGSEFDLGMVTMLASLPLLLIAPWAGAWADRFDRRKLMIFTQMGMMLTAFALSALVLTETVQIWHIYALSLASGIFAAIDLPALQAFLGDLAGRDEMRPALNLNVTMIQISRMIGPALAGFVVGTFGAGIAFFLNGITFLAVIYSLLIVRARHAQERSISESAISGFRHAWAFIMSKPRQRDLILFAAIATFFGIAIVMSLLPAVADSILRGGPDTLGALMSASGAGALIGVMIFAPLAQAHRRTGVVLCFALCGAGVGFLVLGSSTILPLSMLGLFIAGLAMPTVITTTMGLLQFNAPPEMRARVMSLFNMVSFGLQPIAALWVGFMATQIGLQNAIMLNAIGLIASGAIMVLRAPLRNWINLPVVPAEVIAEPVAGLGD